MAIFRLRVDQRVQNIINLQEQINKQTTTWTNLTCSCEFHENELGHRLYNLKNVGMHMDILIRDFGCSLFHAIIGSKTKTTRSSNFSIMRKSLQKASRKACIVTSATRKQATNTVSYIYTTHMSTVLITTQSYNKCRTNK